MKAIRIVLHQTSANYRKEETIENKMTYPLPPFSTVIGAIHNACRYREYHEMYISIQGTYESMHREPYTDYSFLNSTLDDRGILVKMTNENMLSGAFEKIAEAKKQGSSFLSEDMIKVYNKDLLLEYQNLKHKSKEIKKHKNNVVKPLIESIKEEQKKLALQKKQYDKKSDDYEKIQNEEKELKKKISDLEQETKKYEEDNYSIPFSRFRSLTTSLKFYEILDEINLILHITAEDYVLDDILENVYSIKSIGRSEDFVDIISCDVVDLVDYDGEELTSNNSAYLDIGAVREQYIMTKVKDIGKPIIGTKYKLNKNYIVDSKKRKFEKVDVIYASEYSVDSTEDVENVYIDFIDENNYYIVNLL